MCVLESGNRAVCICLFDGIPERGVKERERKKNMKYEIWNRHVRMFSYEISAWYTSIHIYPLFGRNGMLDDSNTCYDSNNINKMHMATVFMEFMNQVGWCSFASSLENDVNIP